MPMVWVFLITVVLTLLWKTIELVKLITSGHMVQTLAHRSQVISCNFGCKSWMPSSAIWEFPHDGGGGGEVQKRFPQKDLWVHHNMSHVYKRGGKSAICRKRSHMLMARIWTFGLSPWRKQLEPAVAVAAWASLISTPSLWGWLWSSLVTIGMRIGMKTLAVSIVLTKMHLHGFDSTHDIKVTPIILTLLYWRACRNAN